MELTREQILAVDDTQFRNVPVPEWGEGAEVRVRGLTAKERDDYEAEMFSIDERRKKGERVRANFVNARAKLVQLSVVNEDGERKFSETDIAKLGKKNAAVMTRIFAVAQELSGMSDEDVAELDQAFDGAQDDGSSSE